MSDITHADYLAAVAAAPLQVVAPFLRSMCPECDEMICPEDPDHAMIGCSVVIGCEGFFTVDPNAVGLSSPRWVDWRPGTAHWAADRFITSCMDGFGQRRYWSIRLMAHALASGALPLDVSGIDTSAEVLDACSGTLTFTLTPQDWSQGFEALCALASGDFAAENHPEVDHGHGLSPWTLNCTELEHGVTLAQMSAVFGGDVLEAARTVVRLYPGKP